MEKSNKTPKSGSGYHTYIQSVASHYLRRQDQKDLIDWHSSGFRLFEQYEELLARIKRENPRAFLTENELPERQFYHCPTSVDVPYKKCFRK